MWELVLVLLLVMFVTREGIIDYNQIRSDVGWTKFRDI